MYQYINDYEIYEQIGKGGFATVYRARNKKNQDVAIKIISRKLMRERKFEEKVVQEIKIHSQLSHNNVIKLLDHFNTEDHIYLVLELCENDTLKRYLDENGRLSESEARDILMQIVEGLLYLQEQNIIHRDIKPDNLLLTKDMQVKIADFGLAAQLTAPDDKHMTMCGTPNYISPEVATRSSHGLEADCWALGCILFALLVGKPPFDSGSAKYTVTKVVMKNPEIPKFVSKEASELIQKLLQKDPLKRMKLNDVLDHPFMKNSSQSRRSKHTSHQKYTPYELRDSGMGTNSFSRDVSPLVTYNSSNRSRSRSKESYTSRTHSSKQPPPIDTFKVVSTDTYKVKSKYLQEVSHYSSAANRLPNHLPTKFNKNYFEQEENEPPSDYYQPNPSRDINTQRSNSQNRYEDRLTGNVLTLNQKCLNWCNEINRELQIDKSNNNELSTNHSKRSYNDPSIERLDIPPLSVGRLPFTRHKSSKAVFSILETGEVCIESIKKFTKRKKDVEFRVMNVCRITEDGLRIALYKPNGSRGVLLTDIPTPLPEMGVDHIYSYESLPKEHWKKYKYAARFVDLVRAKTSKITLYSPCAKCLLMENSPDPDFEVTFYKGEKLTKSGSNIKFVDLNSQTTTFDINEGDIAMENNPEHQEIWIHFKQCHQYCLSVESAMSSISFPFGKNSCFPLIIGRRPSNNGNKSQTISSPQPGAMLPSFTSGASLMSKYGSSNKPVHSCNPHLFIARVEVPNIGIAQQSPNGDILIRYLDGAELWVPGESDKAAIVWQSSTGVKTEYSVNDHHMLTSDLKKKLSQVPYVAKLLAESYTKQKPGIVR